MIVEPTPTQARSRRRRVLRVAAVGTPVALLAVAVAVGALGPRPAEPELVLFPSPLAAAPSPEPTEAPSLTAATSPDPESPPATFDGIPVVRYASPVAEAERRPPEEVVALSGRLLLDDLPGPPCLEVQDEPVGPWCERRAWLSTNWTEGGVEPPHLALRIPTGVRMPATAPGVAPDRRPLVLVLARWLPEDEACMDRGPGCVDELVVERFAWSDGERLDLAPLLDPDLPGAAGPDPFEGLDGGVVPLSALLTWPERMAFVEAPAADAAAMTRDGDPAWYIRAAVLDRDGRWTARWAVLAAHDLGVLGAGFVSDETLDDHPGPG